MGKYFADNGATGTADPNLKATWEYLYDDNGNMIHDENKGLDVTYNQLNLPTVVDFGSGNRIEWSYDVTGAKLRKTVYEAGSISDTRNYLGGIEYINGELDFVATEEGRAVKQLNGIFYYVYDMIDHLGNVRVSFTCDDQDHPVMMQKDAYYPFGMRMDGLSYDNSNDNNYLYNGKELEEEHGLNWYHYGALFYDPQLGRWHVVDPADELNSSYCYVANNPIIFIAPDGCKLSVHDQSVEDWFNESYGIELQYNNPDDQVQVTGYKIIDEDNVIPRDMLDDMINNEFDLHGIEFSSEFYEEGSAGFSANFHGASYVPNEYNKNQGTIIYCPDGEYTYYQYAGVKQMIYGKTRKMPDDEKLHHELKHAHDDSRGILKRKDKNNSRDEARARKQVNQDIREPRNVIPRALYGK